MTENNLGKVAALAFRNLDRKTAASMVASLAATLARRDGSNPTVRKLAHLVADGLAVTDDRADQSPQTSSRPAGGTGWQRAQETLRSPSGRTPDASAAPPRLSAGPGTAPQEAIKGILSGYYDTANIGRHTFSLMNGAQLQVGTPRSPGNIGGLFWLEGLPQSVWHQLRDRNSRLLKVWVMWRGRDLHVMVDAGPTGAAVVSASDQGR